MCTFQEVVVIVCIYACLATPQDAQSQTGSRTDKKVGDVSISVLGLEVRGETLRCRYRIENGSRDNIWLCNEMEAGCVDFEAVWGEDRRTFVIRKRTDLKWDVARDTPMAHYRCLPAGEGLTQTLLLPLPLCAEGVVSTEGVPPASEEVTRIALEIGYYAGDLPARIRDNLQRNTARQGLTGCPPVLHFNEFNEYCRDSAEEIFFLLHPTSPVIRGEQVLHTAVTSLGVPAKEGNDGGPSAPDLQRCDRLEITYEPSAFEYLFPYRDQQRLFSAEEVQFLQSTRPVVVDEAKNVKEFARQIGHAGSMGISVRNARARVICYENKRRLAELSVYDDCFVTEKGEPFSCPGAYSDGYFLAFRQLAPHMRPFELRFLCARNLGYLYERFRLYPQAERWRLVRLRQDSRTPSPSRAQLGYPVPTEWCDSTVSAYENIGMLDEPVRKPFRCPAAGEGQCHYALNPNCRVDSPRDTVLLFETKAGWNPHGGPDLFTFDNHDPKGGLVLLNDGTVKFIRTEEELKQLRWK
jgi:hypothetical protein